MSCSPPFRWLVQGRLAIAGAFEAGHFISSSPQFHFYRWSSWYFIYISHLHSVLCLPALSSSCVVFVFPSLPLYLLFILHPKGQMSAISTQFKSALYLCIDNDTDRAVQGGGGFDDVSVALMGNANHIAYDPSTHDPSSHLYSIKAIQDYLKYQNALDSMERPTVIICKSSRRYTYTLIPMFVMLIYKSLILLIYKSLILLHFTLLNFT